MTSKNDLLKELQVSIVEGDQERAKQAAEACLQAGVDPLEAVEYRVGYCTVYTHPPTIVLHNSTPAVH